VNLVVIVPSRGRPRNIAALADAWTATKAAADVIVAVDDDDPTRGDYLDVVASHPRFDIVIGPRLRMAGTLNKVAASQAPMYDALGFMGDDHRPRTLDWDHRVTAELDRLGTGLVYGDDLLQGANLPTAVFMTAGIIRTLGWMAPPGLVHLFLDNAWLTLGRALDAISYLPDVVIEHCHPIAGKAEHDDGYAEANAAEVWAHDQAVFERWRDEQLAVDVAKIRTAVSV
jgi:hypothetical protein